MTDEQRKKNPGGRVWTFDFDETITTAPKRLSRIAAALRAMGDTVYVLTGNPSPRDDLLKRLDDYGFPYDDLIQYDDEGSSGVVRAAYLDKLKAWGAFDNRADRAVTYAEICPHLYLIAKPSKDAVDDGRGANKDAKKDVKKIKRALLIGGPADGQEIEHHGLSNTLEIDGHLYQLQPDGNATHLNPKEAA